MGWYVKVDLETGVFEKSIHLAIICSEFDENGTVNR